MSFADLIVQGPLPMTFNSNDVNVNSDDIRQDSNLQASQRAFQNDQSDRQAVTVDRPVLTNGPGASAPALPYQQRQTAQRRRTQHECPHPGCDQTFWYPKDVRRHLTVHQISPGRPFKCAVVGCSYQTRGFSRKDALTRHVRRVHGGNDL